MLADFVSKRGGGLLMLGGRRSFAEGGWAGTPVAEVLPVELETRAAAARPRRIFARAHGPPDPRRASSYPVTQLAADRKGVDRALERPAASERASTPFTPVKPGATVLLTGADDSRQEQVVLAYQRYGRGKALAFPIQDSWIWKMDATMPGRPTRRTRRSGGASCAGSSTACPIR